MKGRACRGQYQLSQYLAAKPLGCSRSDDEAAEHSTELNIWSFSRTAPARHRAEDAPEQCGFLPGLRRYFVNVWRGQGVRSSAPTLAASFTCCACGGRGAGADMGIIRRRGNDVVEETGSLLEIRKPRPPFRRLIDLADLAIYFVCDDQ